MTAGNPLALLSEEKRVDVTPTFRNLDNLDDLPLDVILCMAVLPEVCHKRGSIHIAPNAATMLANSSSDTLSGLANID